MVFLAVQKIGKCLNTAERKSLFLHEGCMCRKPRREGDVTVRMSITTYQLVREPRTKSVVSCDNTGMVVLLEQVKEDSGACEMVCRSLHACR